MIDEGYAEALDWLFSRTRAGSERSTLRMQRLMGAMGLTAPARVVHVVGTNGKGTVSAMIQAGLTANGLRTGLFISPHVVDYCERISVSGELIERRKVIDFVRRLQAGPLPEAAFFELSLALGLEHFAAEAVDALVLEAGVGARNDASLAVGNTVLTVMTSIALDHTATLGDTLSLITEDKAAAIRPGVPVVTAERGEALEVIARVAAELGSPLHHPDLEPELFAVPDQVAATGTRGRNQALAAAGLRLLGAGSETSLLAGTGRSPLPGRGERFLVRGREVLLDGAHDPAAAAELVRPLAAGYTLLYAGLGRKQREATLGKLAVGAARIFVTELEGEAAPEWPAATVIPQNRAALEAALDATPEGGLLVISGSLYLAGSMRPLVTVLAQP